MSKLIVFVLIQIDMLLLLPKYEFGMFIVLYLLFH